MIFRLILTESRLRLSSRLKLRCCPLEERGRPSREETSTPKLSGSRPALNTDIEHSHEHRHRTNGKYYTVSQKSSHL